MALPFFGIGMKTDLFQSCGHCCVFQMCWHIECSTFTASSFRIWNSSTGIPSPPLALFVVMLSKAHLTSHSRILLVQDNEGSSLHRWLCLYVSLSLTPCGSLQSTSLTLTRPQSVHTNLVTQGEAPLSPPRKTNTRSDRRVFLNLPGPPTLPAPEA